MTTDVQTLALMKLSADDRAVAEEWDAALRAVTEPVTHALRSLAARMGVSYGTTLRKWYAWRARGVDGLVSRAKGARRRELSPEFVAWWKQLCLENQRKCKPAYRKFKNLWHSGALIPGMDPNRARYKLPRGYTYENLMRHAPSRFELLAARQGLRAADAYRPLVFTTRANMKVGQEIVFDDVWHDFEVVVLGQREPSRLLQLCAMDVFSGCLVDLATKPTTRRADNTRECLSETEALFYVAHVLEDHGFYADGARLIVEAGTMTVNDEVCKSVHELSGGRLVVHVGHTSNAVAFAGHYAGMARGNFRLKGMLESWFNLLHNETADTRLLPGQTGSNARLNAPDDLHGRHQDVAKWLQTMPALSQELQRQVRLGLVEFHAADRLVRDITERINRRQEHELEGYLEAGLTAVDYELPGIGLLPAAQFEQRLAALESDEQRAAVKAFAVAHARKMSPRETYESGRAQLRKFRPEHIARMLFSARRSEPVKVGHDHLITLEDKLISPEPLRFLAHTFRPGDKFDAILNPWSPDKLHLFDASGRWLGVVNAWQRADRTDAAAIEAQMAEAARVQNQMRAPLRKLGMEVTLERLEATRENIAAMNRMEALGPEQNTPDVGDCTADILSD